MKIVIVTGIAVLLGFAAPGARAQVVNQRTFVSGAGTDAGACSVVAPCRTFQYAVDRTRAGGEVNVETSGAYGPVTITKSISIVADGALAEVDVTPGTTGVSIAASTVDTVVLRGLTVSGHGSARAYGVRVATAGRVVVDHCTLTGLLEAITVASPTVTGSVTNSLFSLNDAALVIGTQRPTIALGNDVVAGNNTALIGRFISFGDNDIFANGASVRGGNTVIAPQAKQ